MQPTLILLADSVYEAALMLTWGIVAIVTAGYAMTSSSRSAAAERATWRASVGSILLLCMMELLGVNSAVVGLIPLVDLEPQEFHLAASDSRGETFESGVARTSSVFSESPWKESLTFEVSTEAAAQGVDESPPDQESPIQESADAPGRSPLGLAARSAAQSPAPAYSISDSQAAIDLWVEAEIEQADEMKVIECADANRPLDRPPIALVSQSDVPAMRPASSEPSRWPSAVAQSAPNLLAAVWIFGVVFCVVRNVRQQVLRRTYRGEDRLGADFTRPLGLRPTRVPLPPMADADEVARLRNEVESVRDEMHEMRAMLERLLERRDAHEEKRKKSSTGNVTATKKSGTAITIDEDHDEDEQEKDGD